ncbi:hypothetical protein M9458_054047 [Cirrhinus mrigala]|uniref:Uncharacterized protein n=1 Tax=Cirrhinus mrigala TaxID=683832 RepID=A0ABD0MNS3_CIRMR
MAEARYSQDQLTCPVCMDLLKDPVTIQCGHSYCKSCITDCWDQEDQMRVYSCPQCRQTFSPRPALATNIMLAELVEKLKKTKLPADCYAGAGDVQCDVCTGRKYKAVKSCLVCQESFCQTHFDCHEEFHSRKPHKVIDATGRLQEMICQKHEKHLEMYCITDQQCICELCTKYEHKNHNTVSAASQRTEKQKQLKETQKTFQQREKDLRQLREAVESHKHSAQTAVEDSERIFTELIRSIERSCSELIQLIRDQEKRAVSRAEGRLERLEQEINDLRRRDAELEQLLHTQDHIQFLQRFQSLSAPPESTDENDVPYISLVSFDGLKDSVHQLRDKLEDFCKKELKNIPDRVTFTNVVLWTRNDFLQYSRQLTLDLNTAHKRLHLSESNRVITDTDTVQSYPDHPDRFDVYYQWITSFLTDRQQLVRLGKLTSGPHTISTGAPHGCVLSPLLFSLYTNECISKDPSVKLLKFPDDTTVIGLIQDGDESAYRQDVEQLSLWCSHNNLELNTLKTVEMKVDFRRNPNALPPLTIMNSTVAAVDSFKFLGTNIYQDIHIDSNVKKAQQRLYFLRQLKKFNLPQALMAQFYSAVIESVLCSSVTVWFGAANKSDIRRLQLTVRTAEKITGVHLPNLQDLYNSRVKKQAGNIIKDPSHPRTQPVCTSPLRQTLQIPEH